MKNGFGTFLMMVASMGAFSNNVMKRSDELDGIDIAAEYELIQQKKSRLSRRLRDMVCRRYESSKN